MRPSVFMLFAAGGLLCAPSRAALADDWTEYRGPGGTGLAANSNPPVEWSESSHIRWKTAVPGKAWSSPVVLGEQIWLTNADEEGKRLSAVCIDKSTGRVLRDLLVFENEKPQFCYPFNSYASSTPTIEKGRIYAHYGSHGTACLDTQTGKTLWTRRDLPCDHYRGAGSSPVVFENLLLLQFDGFDVQYVIALDKRTGKTVWKRDREIDYQGADGDAKKAYGTPKIIEVDGRIQAVSSGAGATIAYDPRTGDELWRLRHGGMNTAARPLYADGLAYLFTGDGGMKLAAMHPEGRGDVTESGLAWKFDENVPSRTSPLIVDGLLFMVNEKGIATCLDAKTGKKVWTERLLGEFTSSLVSAGGRIYAFDQNGASFVFSAGREFKLLAENRLDDGCMATPAIVGDSLIVRTKTHLYCIAE